MKRVQCGRSVYVFQEYRPDFEVDFPIAAATDRELDESAEWWAEYMNSQIDDPEPEDPEVHVPESVA